MIGGRAGEQGLDKERNLLVVPPRPVHLGPLRRRQLDQLRSLKAQQQFARRKGFALPIGLLPTPLLTQLHSDKDAAGWKMSIEWLKSHDEFIRLTLGHAVLE